MTLPPDCEDALIRKLRQVKNSLPMPVRMFVKPIPEMLDIFPECCKDYTVREVLDAIDRAHRDGLL